MSLVTAITERAGRAKQIGRTAARRDIFLWSAVILFVNYLFDTIKETPAQSLAGLIADFGAIGIFQYLAWYVIFRLLLSSYRVGIARLQDVLVITALIVPVFLPTGKTLWIAATCIAIYWRLSSAGDRKLRAAAVVLAALSVQELWGHILFNLITSPLLRAETAVVGTILSVVRLGTVWHDNAIMGPNGFGIVIINSCSSFHNLSLALLCWVTVSRLRHQDWRVRDFGYGAGIGILMILFNVIRICLMAWNADLYHYWHDGDGAVIFAIGASLTVLSISVYAAKSSEQEV